MSGKHKRGTPSYGKWIESYRKKKPIKHADANLNARKPHKPVNPEDEDVEKSAGPSFASMAPTVKTKEFRAGQRAERAASAGGGGQDQMKTGYGGVGGQGFGKSFVPEGHPAQENVRAQSLGMSPPGIEGPDPAFLDKAVSSSSSDGSLDSATFVNTQSELKKEIGGMPSVTAAQARPKKGPAYGFEEDGAGNASVQKGYNMERVRLAWDLHQSVKKEPHYNLKKSDPVKGSITLHGIECSIEWPKGSIRRYKQDGVMKDGKPMQASYGYVPDTITADGEELDVYVGPNRTSKKVYLLLQRPTPWDISQNNLDPEEKYMIGFDDIDEARKAFCGSMPSKFFKNIREVNWEYFINRIKKAHKKLEKHTEAESCGYLYKHTLDKYDRSNAHIASPEMLKLAKSFDKLISRVNSITRLVLPK